MNDKPIQPSPAVAAASSAVAQQTLQPGSKPGAIGAAAYFDRAGILWIAVCVILAVAAGYFIPRADSLLSPFAPSVPSAHPRFDYAQAQLPAAADAVSSSVVSSAISGQPSAQATSATGEKKVW